MNVKAYIYIYIRRTANVLSIMDLAIEVLRANYAEMLICLSLLFFCLPNLNGPSISPQKLLGGSINVIS
jgi:hypothetical protein